jgi:hypothetical protein
MINIYLPDNFIPEREYIIDFFFECQLGVPYLKVRHQFPFYRILLPNGNDLVIEDHFFYKINENDGYLNKRFLPKNINYFQHEDFKNEAIPIIFGENRLSKCEVNSLNLGADIFASAFFMLTRWEEHVLEIKDEHNRFPAKESLAYKNNFLNRPLVNEYTELLWELLVYSGYKGSRKRKEFRIIPTHDIDLFQYWDVKRIINLPKNLVGDIFIRKNPALFVKRLSSLIKTIFSFTDPCNTFNYLMDKAENSHSKARFYFIAGGETVYESNYSILSRKVRSVIGNIIKRGHLIGIHPSYNSFNDFNLLIREVSDLNMITGQQILETRNHYLRFDVPFTWELLNQAGLLIDSSMYYSEIPGFRCGICNEFTIFDIVQRKKLDIIERPLIVMDTSYKNKESDVLYSEIVQLKEAVKKYHGDFIFLWHNSNINTPEWDIRKEVFETAFYGK